MLRVSSVLSNTPMQSLPPLVDSYVNDVLVKPASFCNQSFFQMIDVTDPATVDSLLQKCFRTFHTVNTIHRGGATVLKVGGHDPPAPMGAPPLTINTQHIVQFFMYTVFRKKVSPPNILQYHE